MAVAASKEIRRLNFYGGPGVGKSTLVPDIFSRLGKKGYDIEHVTEYIKGWAYEGRRPISYDQLYVFAKQLKSEDILLRSGVQLVISDSPVLLNTAYSTMYGFPAAAELVRIGKQFDKDFKTLDFYIDRTLPYKAKGRYQSLKEAKRFDRFLLKFLEKHLRRKVQHCQVTEVDQIVKFIEHKLKT